MPTYAPPAVGANNGGYLLMYVTNGVRTHRMRFHVAPFAAASGTYVTAQGTEANITTTAAAIRGNMQPFWPSSYTLGLAAVYQYQNGLPVQVPIPATVNTAAGTSAGAASAFAEGFQCFSGKSTLGGRYRFFAFEVATWAYGAASTVNAGATGPVATLFNYLTSTNCGVVAHDGGKYTYPVHITNGVNKKLRRRAGNA